MREWCSTLHYRADFTFKKHMIVVEIDENGHNKRPPNYKNKKQKGLERLGYYFIGVNPDKPGFDENLVE